MRREAGLQSGFFMAAPATEKDIQKELDELDKRITALKVTFDKYFLGIERLPPLQEKEEIHKKVTDMSVRFIRNTAAKFRRDALKNKFLSYNRYWDRTLQQIEDGTFVNHLKKAKLRERERLEKTAAPEVTKTVESTATPAAARPAAPAPAANGAKPDPIQRIYEQYVAAKKKSNEGTDGLTRDRMASIISQQTQALKQKYKCKSVEFRVVVEDGKAKLKAIPK